MDFNLNTACETTLLFHLAQLRVRNDLVFNKAFIIPDDDDMTKTNVIRYVNELNLIDNGRFESGAAVLINP